MTPPDDRLSDLRRLFFETAEELVQKLNDEAMHLEKSPGDKETARSLRRTVHTLKGDAAACGFRELSELCHEFEDVLMLENTAAAPLIPAIALRAADVFAALLEAYQRGGRLPNTESLRAEIATLEITGLANAGPASTGLADPAAGSLAASNTGNEAGEPTAAWSEYEHLAISHALAAGKQVYSIFVELDPQCGMPMVACQMISSALAAMGEVLALQAGEEGGQNGERIEAALASDASADQIKASCIIPTVSQKVEVRPLGAPEVRQSVARAAVPDASEKDQTEPNRSAAERSASAAGLGASAAASEGTAAVSRASSDTLLRVDAEKIDSVLNLVGEMILAKSMMQQAMLEFGQRFPKDNLRVKFSDAMAFQSRVLNDLQHSVMKIRMVPVEQLFRRFPRTVRDTALQCGKEVELIVRGGKTDLDKSIMDAIAEPLTHLVRNAISHGVETAEERVRAGKRPRGALRLSAYHQGNQVVIEVSDDGAGIDIGKVRQSAVSQGLVTAEQANRLSEAEILNLILQPGFSTANEVTELSGRGVGLDVVHSVVNRLKGMVEIETVAGRGATFRLRLPLTLAIIRALMFRVGDALYALPLNAVAEIARTAENDIHEVERYEVLQLRDHVLPLLRLGSKLATSGSSRRPAKVFVLVIQSGERKFGLVVDAIESEEEIVIKAIDDPAIVSDLVSGASILGDGRVVLILNLIALIDRFAHASAAGIDWRRGDLRLSGAQKTAASGSEMQRDELQAWATARGHA